MPIQFTFVTLQICYLLLVGRRYCQLYKNKDLLRLAIAFPFVPLLDGVIVLTFIVSLILLGREWFGIVPTGGKDGLISYGVYCVFCAVAMRRLNDEIKVLESRMKEEGKA